MTEHILDTLYDIVKDRKDASPEESYTAKLYQKGTAKIAQKVGEEAVETLIEALNKDNEKLAEESADLLFHLMVLWSDRDLDPSEVWNILKERHKK